MRVAVTSICKNEEQFVERWVRSAGMADEVILIDTGSTDKTIEKFNATCDALGIHGICHSITVNPWRFDHARNAGQALIPSDIDWVIDLDLDEVLVEGWRDALEKAIEDQPDATRFRYPFVWSWNDDGTPAVQFKSDKIRTRNNYFWKHPVHECLYFFSKDGSQEKFGEADVHIHHFPDNSKPRSQYMDLLTIAVAESPNDDRMAHYYARELFFYGKTPEALQEFDRHLELGGWEPERAMSMVYKSKIYHQWNANGHAIKHARLAVAENPNARETWLNLAEISFYTGDMQTTFYAVVEALKITSHPMTYMSDPRAWGSLLYDMGSVAASRLGNQRIAIQWCEKALELEPDNERIQGNLNMLKGDNDERDRQDTP